MKKRCGWVKLSNPTYVTYHDQEWGRPIFTDARHVEYLLLETFQAGLSWETILNKREIFRHAFFQFNPRLIAKATIKDVERWMQMPGMIKHRGKLIAAIENANVFLTIQQTYGSFHNYLTQFTGKNVIHHHPQMLKDLPSQDSVSVTISQDLKKRGMSYIGPTIVYAHLQAIGIIDDHLEDCFVKSEIATKS